MNTRVAKAVDPRQWLLVLSGLLALFFMIRLGHSVQDYDVRSVSAPEARHLIDSGAVVVDVRGPQAYGERHIPGAISVPLDDLRHAVPASLAHAIAKPVVVYCGDGVSIGPEGTALLNKAGFRKAMNLEHGIDGWASAGYPVATPGASKG